MNYKAEQTKEMTIAQVCAECREVTLQMVINGRFPLRTGWSTVEIPESEKKEIYKLVAFNLLGGWEKYRRTMYFTLLYDGPNFGLLERIHITYREGIRVSYCASRDMSAELSTIRKSLR